MMDRKKNYNKYDVFIFILIASLSSGSLFAALQLPRVLALVFLFPSLSLFSTKMELKYLSVCAVFFVVYSFISCLWTPAGFSEGLKAAAYNVTHVILFFDIVLFSSKARNPIKAIVLGVFVAVVISAIIAFWEIATNQHLSTSRLEEAKAGTVGSEVYVRYFAAATFYNFNTYVTFLCFLFPFLLYGCNSKSFNKGTRLLFFIAVISSVILVLFNGSRGGLLALVVMLFVYFFYSVFKLKQFNFVIVLFIAAIGLLLYFYGEVILNSLIIRTATQGALEEESRFVIWSNVLKVIGEYYCIGCGAGGLEYAMEKYAHGGITVAHNVFLEVFSEYGIFFVTFFVVTLIKLYKRVKYVPDADKRICLYQALWSFPIVGIINSGYLTQPVFWTFLASLYCFSFRETDE